MINKKTYTLFLIVFTLAFSSCKKKQYRYPEDPKVTRIKPNDRLFGYWQLSDYTLNGTSIIDALNTKINNEIDVRKIYFQYKFIDDNGHKYYGLGFLSPRFDLKNPFISERYIEFDIGENYSPNMKDSLKIVLFITPFKYSTTRTANWYVTKLYDKDLRLTLQTDTGEYKLFFNKTD